MQARKAGKTPPFPASLHSVAVELCSRELGCFPQTSGLFVDGLMYALTSLLMKLMLQRFMVANW
jgi:hypothetical protein